MCSVHRRGVLTASLIVLCLFSCVPLVAGPVSRDQVRRVTTGFLKKHNATHARGSEGRLVTAEQDGHAALREIAGDQGNVLAYVADLEPRGFVVVSADTDIAPIVAYSFTNPFPDTDVENPLYRMIAEDMRLRAQALAQYPQWTASDNALRWKAYAQQDAGRAPDELLQQWPPEDTTSTGGWLETAWTQGDPFNKFCPLDPVDGARTYVGCVATAFAQILHYHGACATSFNQADAYSTYYGIDVDADSARYDFPSFAELNAYLAVADAKYRAGDVLDDNDLAAVNFACGVVVEMDYSSEGSGAWTDSVADAMKNKFGYHSAAALDGLSYEMIPVLQENLINALPTILAIREPNGLRGHAIVCDGYNTDGEYHLNFGWGTERPDAMTEAWYRLPLKVPSFLSVIVGVTLNIQPDRPVLAADPASLAFYSLPGQESQASVLRIRNTGVDVTVQSISAPEGFLVAGADGVYSDRLGPFDMNDAREEIQVNVKFYSAAAGSAHGVLEIDYDAGRTKYVPLSGCAFAAGTLIEGGAVSGRWSQDASPYFVAGDISVARDGVLIIDPGVQVFFVGPYSMTVGRRARLLAMGNAGNPIEFSAWNRQEGWTGLRFWESRDDDILRHCSLTFAKKGAPIAAETEYEALYYEADPNAAGGAVYCFSSHPTIINCEIANNAGHQGGAIYCYDSRLTLTNTVVVNNQAVGGSPPCGGIFADEPSLLEIANCTIANNAPGGVFSASWEGMSLTNTIVWGNDEFQIEVIESSPTVSFCDIEGGYAGEGNIDADPCFFAPSAGVGAEYDGTVGLWSLQSRSPCLNAGTQIDLPATDVAGNVRVYNDVTDIGAYEGQFDLPMLTIEPSATVDAGYAHVDANSVASLVVRNTGSADVEIEGLSLADANSVFSILTVAEGVVLAPGESMQVDIAFAPQEEVRYVDTLSIYSTASNSGEKAVSLQGVGVRGTIVAGGPVSGTWIEAQSPYAVTGDIHVPMGSSLTIEPGVTVAFAGHFSFTVGYRATLAAEGTPQQNILFTATDTDTGWSGLRFVNSDYDDVLHYCTVEYGKKGRTEGGGFLNLMGGGILCCGSSEDAPGYYVHSSPTINHCVIAHNVGQYGGGIALVDNSDAWITHCRIVDNSTFSYGAGIFAYGAYGLIAHNVIAHNSGNVSGGMTLWYALPDVTNNTIVHNRPNGLHLQTTGMGFWASTSILNNIVWDNEMYVDEAVRSGEYEIRFNDIQGGWPDRGNVDVDPHFADPETRDYHLKSAAGRWDAQNQMWVLDAVTSPCIDAGNPDDSFEDEPAPHGDLLNLGAYGGTAQASKSP